ncbi:MAG: bis(5'-nucleosyl)-tetraphosphatase (symmetrical) YqeK [Chloroflexi bacterium]|nr:bis(5'-nucleosyl)-tetraphosphatase (symmetrical) YqeK [Chloroflexota bacterium]
MYQPERIDRWTAAPVRTIDIEGRLARSLRPETLAHVYRTAELARTLAEKHGVNPDLAELAALLHKVADGYSDRELLRLAEYYEVPIDATEARVPRLLHGKIGAEILRHEWRIMDPDLLRAVRNYVSGAPNMQILDKVLFLADKLEPERDRFYGDLDPVRALALVDPDAAIRRLSAWTGTRLLTANRCGDALAPTRNRLIEFTRATSLS